eukprot:Phypoly_transcript_14078.p1 GENE.Phypoly_transcript_14078~~Phypoly_transcript_14078.p1  ORF type:complete len:269 (+),score=48.80 Phypoly_transcript_14078:90-896(+)
MKFAFYQGGKAGDVEYNLKLLEQKAHEAASAGANLIVFPELFLCGYGIAEKITELAETKNGTSFKRIQKAAKDNNIAIAYGYAEKYKETTTYNSVALLRKDGERIINYRKTHLYSDYERKYFKNHEKIIPIAELEGLRVAILICYDIEFPEPARILAINGAQFVIVPTANCSKFVPEITVRSRAHENHIFVAYINRVGKEGQWDFCGTSICVAPNGDILAQASGDKEELCYALLDNAAVAYESHRTENPFFVDRLPHLYETISTPLKK